MPLDQALEELKKYAEDFIAVGDANQAIAANKDEFFHKWTKVFQYYNYIVTNSKVGSPKWFDALDVLSDIELANPSLEEWVKRMIGTDKQNTKTQNKSNIDTSALTSGITAIVEEINHMRSWDTNYIGELEWKLKDYQKKLIENKDAFSPNVYQSLTNDINMTLGKIDRFNKMVNSDLMDSMRRI